MWVSNVLDKSVACLFILFNGVIQKAQFYILKFGGFYLVSPQNASQCYILMLLLYDLWFLCFVWETFAYLKFTRISFCFLLEMNLKF